MGFKDKKRLWQKLLIKVLTWEKLLIYIDDTSETFPNDLFDDEMLELNGSDLKAGIYYSDFRNKVDNSVMKGHQNLELPSNQVKRVVCVNHALSNNLKYGIKKFLYSKIIKKISKKWQVRRYS